MSSGKKFRLCFKTYFKLDSEVECDRWLMGGDGVWLDFIKGNERILRVASSEVLYVSDVSIKLGADL